ncbi:expressed unknown protein [Seminavis robusta]|uniref:Uncharacterized protein n=1 Tax=Seminavis robusta TaxID=568900 RepID=A0A9N8EFH1_9STRA|nr:expressed unknown protein [Seminavis robusta]|eukprot:Sro860_g212130.1 n/a (193) ;mRNA; f:17779-18490
MHLTSDVDEARSDEVFFFTHTKTTNDNAGEALEAIRVDDIMTVKAEPLSIDRGRSKLYQTIAYMFELVNQRFEPFYNVNYNTSSGRDILQDVFRAESSPQARALNWIARFDPQTEAVTRPALDEFETNAEQHARVGDAVFGGDNRKLSLSEPTIHDRIVQPYRYALDHFVRVSVGRTGMRLVWCASMWRRRR